MKKTAAIIYLSFICAIALLFTQIAYYNITLPDIFYKESDDCFSYCGAFGISSEEQPMTFSVNETDKNNTATLMLYGVIPIKEVSVRSVKTPMLIPSGKAFGLKMLTEGVIVTDFGVVESENGSFSPAQRAGVEAGDVITHANGKQIQSSNDLTTAINLSPKNIELVINRNGKELTFEINAEKSVSDGKYKLGLWTRDSCAGIGTLTFIDEENGTFAGLGHGVCDAVTGQLLPLSSGSIVPVTITDVRKSIDGFPGELSGSCISGKPGGEIITNNNCGIYGTISEKVEGKAIPMGFKQEATIGKATILCTTDKGGAEEYEIVIEKINPDSTDSERNMTIRITDEHLLKRTGGIVQGMSGSPIIQNGKLIGAVTHVFVNDVERGYAIFAENMYAISSELTEEQDVA